MSFNFIVCVVTVPSFVNLYIYGLVQDYSNSIANALELRQYCTKPSIYQSK